MSYPGNMSSKLVIRHLRVYQNLSLCSSVCIDFWIKNRHFSLDFWIKLTVVCLDFWIKVVSLH